MEHNSDKLSKTKPVSEFDFFNSNYCLHVGEKGNLYTWGSGEMGQLGYNSKIIA
jgi:alpha-tubulin suppressor-like RCC1 family protein